MKKIYKYILLCVFLSNGLILGADFLTVSSTQKNIYTSSQDLPYNKVWLVLGTSKYIADGRRNLFYIYRLNAVQELYNAKKIEYVLVSGDNSTQQYNETDSMKEDLIAMWIPEKKIFWDYAGFRTLDSVVRAKEIFQQESYTVITQNFHLQRALFLAKSKNIQAVWYPAKDVPVKLAPRVWLRERLARVKMMIDLVFWVDPKFLWEKITIE